MQNFPPLPPYQFFWNWIKCFNSEKPTALQAKRQATTWLLFQAPGWTSVDFEHQGVFYSLISFLSSAPHNWKLSFKFDLELSTPGSCLWRRNKNGCRKHTFAVHAANVNGKKNNNLSSTKCVRRDLERYIHADMSFPLGIAKANKRKEKNKWGITTTKPQSIRCQAV